MIAANGQRSGRSGTASHDSSTKRSRGNSTDTHDASRGKKKPNVTPTSSRMLKRYVPDPLGDLSRGSASEVSTVKRFFSTQSHESDRPDVTPPLEYGGFRVRNDMNTWWVKVEGATWRRVLCTRRAEWKHHHCLS